MAAKGPSLMARGPTKMVASICPILKLSGLLSSCQRFPESKGQTVHLASGVFTPNVAAQLPVPPAINYGGAETTSLLHPLNSPMTSLSPVLAFNGLEGPTRPAVAKPGVVEAIEESRDRPGV